MVTWMVWMVKAAIFKLAFLLGSHSYDTTRFPELASTEDMLTGVIPMWRKLSMWKRLGATVCLGPLLDFKLQAGFFLPGYVIWSWVRGLSAWELQRKKTPQCAVTVNNIRPPIVLNTVTTVEKQNTLSYNAISPFRTVSSCAYEHHRLTSQQLEGSYCNIQGTALFPVSVLI